MNSQPKLLEINGLSNTRLVNSDHELPGRQDFKLNISPNVYLVADVASEP